MTTILASNPDVGAAGLPGSFRFAPVEEFAETTSAIWPALKIPKLAIEAEIERLAAGNADCDGRRRSAIVHPSSKWNSLTPGIRATLEVILPGECFSVRPQSSSSVSLSILGRCHADVDDRSFPVNRYDVWSVPNLARQTYRNDSSETHARLTFSDAPLFEQLWAHYVEETAAPGGRPPSPRQRDPRADLSFPLRTAPAAVKTYHAFVDPEIVEQVPVHWPWEEVHEFLATLDKSHEDWRASMIALLWNRATGRTNGSTNSLTAFMSGGVYQNWQDGHYDMARTHRHSITAVNYALTGNWRTIVEGEEILWGPGDLVITAPAWGRHSNGTCDREAYTFTVQDASLHGALNSSVHQEYMNRPPVLLGSHAGFEA